MNEYYDEIKEQSRGDKHVDTGNFNQMVRKSNSLGRTAIDPATTVSQRKYGSRTEVVASRAASTVNATRMFDVKRVGSGEITYRPGIWERGGGIAGTRITAYPVPSLDPISFISGTGNEIIWIYAVLADSRGHALVAPALTHDYAFDSAFWTGTAAGVHIVIRDRPIADTSADRVDPFDQWKLIAQAHFTSGKITKIVQLHRGPIESPDPVYSTMEEDESFRTYLQYSDAAADYLATLTPVLGVENGNYKRRDATGTISGTTFAFATLAAATPDEVYAYLGPEDSAWSVDRSLIPGSETIGLSDAAGATYADYRLPLCSFRTATDVLGQPLVYVSVRWAGGDWISDWMRPDGQLVGGTLGATIDADVPKIASLDFDATGAHAGELQLGRAYAQLVTGATITNDDGDFAIPYVRYATSGFSLMDYARPDGVRHTTWEISASVDIVGAQLTLFDFLSATGKVTPSGGTDPATFFTDKLLLLRDDSGDYPILKYADLTDLFDWADGNWDQVSVNPVNGSGKGQIHGFEAATTTTQTPVSTDLFPFKDESEGTIEWVEMQSMVTAGIPHTSLIRQTTEATGAGWSDFDDHGGGNALGGRINDGYALMLLGAVATKAGMYTRNGGNNYLGDSLFVETNLYVSDIFNEAGASGWTKRIDVENCRLYETDGTTLTIDWHLRTLTGGVGQDWSVILGHKFLVLDTTDVTDGTAASGACQITGGLGVAKGVQANRFSILGSETPNENRWDDNEFYVNADDGIISIQGASTGLFEVSSDLALTSTNSLVVIDAKEQIEIDATTYVDIDAGTYVAIDAVTDINLTAINDLNISANQITINSVTCIYQTAAVVGQLTVNEGFVTGFTVITPAADNTYNNPTSITTVDGHITAIS